MLVRPLSAVDNTRDYARVSHSRQWSNYNVVRSAIVIVHPSVSVTLCIVAKRHFLFTRSDRFAVGS